MHPALSTIASAVEDVRKVAAMLTADEVWTFTDADLELMVRAQSELDSAGFLWPTGRSRPRSGWDRS